MQYTIAKGNFPNRVRGSKISLAFSQPLVGKEERGIKFASQIPNLLLIRKFFKKEEGQKQIDIVKTFNVYTSFRI